MSMREVIDAAQGKWPEILRKYGVEEKVLRNAHGPCPICKDGKDRFRFDDKGGFGTYFCSQCGAGYGLDLLAGITGRTKRELADELATLVGTLPAAPATAAPDMRKRIEWITSNLRHASEVPEVIAYLKGRGLKPSSDTFALPAVRYYAERKLVGEFAAMVTRFCAPSGELITYHLTHVRGGRKADVPSPRKVLTPLGTMAGGALRLTRIYHHLGLAEGVETALAVMRDFRLPCWAAANAGMLEKFTPPAGVEVVTIFADNDASFTGQDAAFGLARRLTRDGLVVNVKVPDQVGDFADAKREAVRA
jgi:putative DNA primase/helicase